MPAIEISAVNNDCGTPSHDVPLYAEWKKLSDGEEEEEKGAALSLQHSKNAKMYDNTMDLVNVESNFEVPTSEKITKSNQWTTKCGLLWTKTICQ
ncbi:hypothetical protein TNCV_2442391 [Trichonephila clavipes]|nr:hypothetical protein TNCV_2442391 [Trichonephila clavipes]